jgi:hypothetical protein
VGRRGLEEEGRGEAKKGILRRRAETHGGRQKMKDKKPKICTAWGLAEALSKTHLSEEEARAWRRDLKSARKKLKAPVDKWRRKR